MLDGSVHPDYADVASSLVRQIPPERHAGAAVCVYHEGRSVVDIWGGQKDADGNAWESGTIAPSFSTSKGVLSTLVHILVDQDRADYSDPVAEHWPDFGARGKDGITIRDVLTHRAGLYRITELIQRPSEMLDWEHMKRLVADAEPAHTPGQTSGYHGLTFGWIVGGLIEAITGKPLETVLHDELVEPLGLDGMYLGVPHNQLYRRATLAQGITEPPTAKEEWREALEEWVEIALEKVGVELAEFRSALAPFNEPFDWNDEATVMAKIPAANGQFTARSLARMYATVSYTHLTLPTSFLV